MIKQSKKVYILPVAMLGVTALAGAVVMVSGAQADDISPIDDDITITVDSACTMGQTTLSSNPTLNPGETNTIGTSRIAAYCNDANGYDIYAIGYTNGEYGNTAMQSTNGSYTIPTGLSGAASYWNMRLAPGTATGSTAYIPTVENAFLTNTTIPDDYTKVASFTSTTIPQTEDPLTYGSYIDATYQAHISTTQPAGVYTGQVQYVMVHPSGAPAPEIPPTYMQDTTTIKAKLTNVGDTMQVVDSRDGKKYWITKLADGNIWMTQNLDLDLSTSTTLTPANTNISSNWTPANGTISFTGTSVSGWQNNNNVPYSADPGELYIYSSGTTSNDDQYTSLEACQAAHPDCSMHNHAGNYYNWSAAVAMNDTSSLTTQYSNASGSICPAGWRLPTGRDSGNTAASREWNALLYAEGVARNPTDDGYTTDGFNKIRKSPLWLARSGYVGNGSLNGIAYYGYYWSSTVSNSYSAYYLYFYFGNVYPSSNYDRDYGYSVRCIAQ